MNLLLYKGNAEPKLKIKKCKKCKSVLVYEENDIRFDTNMDEYIVCPICKNQIYTSIFDRTYNKKKHGKLKEV